MATTSKQINDFVQQRGKRIKNAELSMWLYPVHIYRETCVKICHSGGVRSLGFSQEVGSYRASFHNRHNIKDLMFETSQKSQTNNDKRMKQEEYRKFSWPFLIFTSSIVCDKQLATI